MSALRRTRRRVRRRIAGWRIQSPEFDAAVRKIERLPGMRRAAVLPFILGTILAASRRSLATARAWSDLTGSPLVYEAALRRVLAELAALGIYSSAAG